MSCPPADTRPVALVTGASRGIGAAVARRLARDGHRLALLARGGEALHAVARAVDGRAYPCDLADEAATAQAAAATRLDFGRIDVLVNNAGIVHRHPVAGHDSADWDRVMAVNLKAPFVLARAVLPDMLARGAGRIINISSISGTLGTPNLAAYCASKWGLIGFTKALSEEVKANGVVVVAVSPGSVDTDMLRGSGFAPAMTPEDIADVVAYLACAPAALAGASVEVFG